MTSRTDRAIARSVGETIDAALESLSLWQHDLHTALYYLFTVYEDSIRIAFFKAINSGNDATHLANADTHRMNLDSALPCLVRCAYKMCPLSPRPSRPDVFEWDIYDRAVAALDYGASYEVAVAGLESVMNDRQRIHQRGNSITFTNATPDVVAQDAMSLLVRLIRPHYRMNVFDLLSESNTSPMKEMVDSLRSSTNTVDAEHIVYRVSQQIDDFFGKFAQRQFDEIDLPPSTTIAGYSVNDYRAFYRSIYKFCVIHEIACAVCGQTGHGVGSIVPMITEQQLRDWLVVPGIMTNERLEAILRDAVYDPQLKRADIFWQPLVAVQHGQYYIVPLVVLMSRWERNLHKLWARKHGRSYTAGVQQIKTALSAEIAADFRMLGMTAEFDRRIISPMDGNILTDADLVVVDERSGHAMLAEVKWLIDTHEPFEVRDADDEIAHGIAQVNTVRAYVERAQAEAWTQLLPKAPIDHATVRVLHTAIICRGHIPSQNVVDPNVAVVDYHLLKQRLDTRPQPQNLPQVLAPIGSVMASLREARSFRSMARQFELAGYQFSYPSFNIIPFVERFKSGLFKIHVSGRNDSCPCGSGRKFKKCCMNWL